MGAADFDDVRKFFSFGIERVAKIFYRGEQAARRFRGGGNVHGGGKRVIGGLRHVHIIIGVDGLLAAHDAVGNFDGAIGNHFVDVHVGLRAAAAFPDPKREVLVELSGDDFISGQRDQRGFFHRKLAETLVHERTGFFEDAEGANQFGRHGVLADGEVDERAGGLGAVVAGGGGADPAPGVRLSDDQSGHYYS